MIIGKIIRQLRNSKGIGIRELERLTGINRGNISKIERGAGFGPLQLKRLADQLNTTPAVIFALSEILSGQTEILEDPNQLSSLCKNLTRLFEAYAESPKMMKNEISQMLTKVSASSQLSTNPSAVLRTAVSASSR